MGAVVGCRDGDWDGTCDGVGLVGSTDGSQDGDDVVGYPEGTKDMLGDAVGPLTSSPSSRQ